MNSGATGSQFLSRISLCHFYDNFIVLGNVKTADGSALTVNTRMELCGAFVSRMNVSMFNYTDNPDKGQAYTVSK